MGTKRVIKRSVNAEKETLKEAFEEYIKEKEAHNISEATIRNYKLSFKIFCNESNYTDETTCDEVSNQDIFKWINDLKLDGVKATSINHYLRDIRAFLYWCMEDKKYIEEPFKIKQIENQEEEIKLFTDDELIALLEKPDRRDDFGEWRTWAIVNWVLATGNRAATICNVKIEDVSFSERKIYLTHNKNKRFNSITLSSSLESAIKEYMRMWRKDATKDSWLFPSVGDEKLTTNALRLSFGRYCKGRGVEKSNIHGLRHNFAKGWVLNNGNMFALQSILGHSTLDMTRKYVRMFSEDIKEDYDKFSPLDTIKRNSKRTLNVKRTD